MRLGVITIILVPVMTTIESIGEGNLSCDTILINVTEMFVFQTIEIPLDPA